jgi:hypothetical protein
MTKTSLTAFLWFRSDNRKSAIQNPKWLGFFTIILTIGVGGVVAEAQQPKKVPRIGFLYPGTPSSSSVRIEAFQQGLT